VLNAVSPQPFVRLILSLFLFVASAVPVFMVSDFEPYVLRGKSSDSNRAERRQSVIREAGRKWGLTEREIDVLISLAEGARVQQIAEARGVSENTVRTQTQAIYRKLDVHSRSELSSFIQGLLQ
jgi:DNA-binding NarL/FixJ family response regulator